VGLSICGFFSPICIDTTGLEFTAGMILSQLLSSISSSFTTTIFSHHSTASVRSYPLHADTSTLTIHARPQYVAILHGKELHHE
jgi:hypothetical protein